MTAMRRLGATELTVPDLCLGTHQLGGDWGGQVIESSASALRNAIDAGWGFVDTSISYGDGQANRAIADLVLQDSVRRRERMTICAKIGLRLDPEVGSGRVRDGSPEFLRASVDHTLASLRTPYVDIVMLHFPDPSVDLVATVEALQEIVDSGRARAIGVSNVHPSELEAHHAVSPVAAAQFPLNLMARDPGAAIASTCETLGVTGMAWAPLAQGLLTDHPPVPDSLDRGDYRQYTPWFNDGSWTTRLQLAERIGQVAAASGLTRAQLAIAWIRSLTPGTVPVVGVVDATQLAENVEAVASTLSPAVMAELEVIASSVPSMDLIDAIPRVAADAGWLGRGSTA